MIQSTHLHTILIGSVLIGLKLAVAATPETVPLPPKNVPRTAKITKMNEKTLRFTYEGEEKIETPDGKKRVVLSQFKDASGKVAYRQEMRYEIADTPATLKQSRLKLISFVLVDEQRVRTYRITVEDGKLRYAVQKTPNGPFERSGEETFISEHVAGPMVPLRLEESFPLLLKAKKRSEVRIKLAVPDQADSFTFAITLKTAGGNGKPATLVMSPKSPLVGLIVKPIEFDFDPATGLMVGSRGRTFLEIMKPGTNSKAPEFENFKAEMKFD